MSTPPLAATAAPHAQPWPAGPRPFTLRPVSPALSAAPAIPALPQHFTVQVSAQAYLLQPLPRGLDEHQAVAYVRAFARSRQCDCCIEHHGGGALYLLSDGGQFVVAG